MGTVRVKSVYTCTAQTVQFSRGQGSHHRLYTVQLQESSHKIGYGMNERMNERRNERRNERMHERMNEKILTCRP